MTVEKPLPKQLLRPITTRVNSAMNQSEFLAITCKLLIAREKSRAQRGIGFGFHWLKNWREILKPITKHSNGNDGIITFDSHLKTTLQTIYFYCCFFQGKRIVGVSCLTDIAQMYLVSSCVNPSTGVRFYHCQCKGHYGGGSSSVPVKCIMNCWLCPLTT